jgi:hypothetical protein
MNVTDWVNQVEVLRKKVEGNPFGTVSAGIIIPKDCGLTRDIFQVSLGDTPRFQLNNSEVNNAIIKTLFKEHKVQLTELLNTLTSKVAELEASTDKILGAIVADQIPKAILARMEGASDGYSYQHLLQDLTKEDMESFQGKFDQSKTDNPIKSIELSKIVTVGLGEDSIDWEVSINLNAKVQRVDVGPFNCNHGSFWGISNIKENLLFLLHRKELLAAVDRLLDYLEAGKQI